MIVLCIKIYIYIFKSFLVWQPYTINSAKVIFLNQRPQSRSSKGSANICFTCDRILQEPFNFCSLSCKVHFLTLPSSLNSLHTHGRIPFGVGRKNSQMGSRSILIDRNLTRLIKRVRPVNLYLLIFRSLHTSCQKLTILIACVQDMSRHRYKTIYTSTLINKFLLDSLIFAG